MSSNIGGFVKNIRNIMRNDSGINGDAQRIEELVWILFLKVYDAKESNWEFADPHYESIIPEKFRWRNWAPDHKDGKALTGDYLLEFVNSKLFPALQDLSVDDNTPIKKLIVRDAFTDSNNYMKNGILLRQVINEVEDSVDFDDYKERHGRHGPIELKKRRFTTYMGLMRQPSSVNASDIWKHKMPIDLHRAYGEYHYGIFSPEPLSN